MTFKTTAIALALCFALQAQADTLLGKVINVADGDTITVLDDTNTQHKIRLTGIDAPEKRQAFGNVSKLSLADMVAGQSVAVECVKVDKYGRKLGRVLLAGLDCNLKQIKRGRAQLAAARHTGCQLRPAVGYKPCAVAAIHRTPSPSRHTRAHGH